jgi:hypothetical protein
MQVMQALYGFLSACCLLFSPVGQGITGRLLFWSRLFLLC